MGERFDSSLHAWDHLAEVEDRSELSREWLSLVVAMIRGVRLGLVLLREEGGEGSLPADVWPEAARGVDKLALVAHEALKEGGRGSGGGRHTTRRVLVVVEVDMRST